MLETTQADRALGEQIAARLSAAQALPYLLIDGALCPVSRVPWLQRGTTRVVAPRSSPQATAEALPYLVEATALGRAQFAQMVRFARETSGVTWLASTLSGQELAAALSLRTEAVLPQSLPVFLRLADARVLPVIHQVLSDEQRGAFFSAASAWCYLDRQHQLAQLQLPKSYEAPFSSPLWLTEAQEQALLKAAEPDAVLRLLAENDHEALEGVPANERHAFVVKQMARAAHWGLSAPVDMALYCSMALTYGHDFDLQAEWGAKLHNVKLGRQTVAQLLG